MVVLNTCRTFSVGEIHHIKNGTEVKLGDQFPYTACGNNFHVT